MAKTYIDTTTGKFVSEEDVAQGMSPESTIVEIPWDESDADFFGSENNSNK